MQGDMFVTRVGNTVANLMIICLFLGVTSCATTKLLTLLPPGLQPGIFLLLCIVYWLMLDNITFATDLMAAETRTLLHQEAGKTATKIAVAVVAAAADAGNAFAKHRKHDQHVRKRASSWGK